MVANATLNDGDTIPGTVRHFSFSGHCGYSASNQEPGSPIIACYYGSPVNEVMSGVYATGVAGVGIRLRNSAGQVVTGAGIQCDSRGSGLGVLDSQNNYSINVSIEFVKTGPITGGALNPTQTRFGFGVYQGNGLGGASNYIGFSGNLAVKSVTCSVNSPSTVRLPAVGLSSLSQMGTIARRTPFNIGLVCNSDLKVRIRMEPAAGVTSVDPAAGILDSQGSAQGVGIQLLKSDFLPMPLNQRVDMGNISANGQVNYGFFAQYLRTGATITPGTVQSQMVFTFEYE
ncbi:Fimbrial protein [compost metagenome]